MQADRPRWIPASIYERDIAKIMFHSAEKIVDKIVRVARVAWSSCCMVATLFLCTHYTFVFKVTFLVCDLDMQPYCLPLIVLPSTTYMGGNCML
jgi:hypothetical protein